MCELSTASRKKNAKDCRFPCRAILLHSREDYQSAMPILKYCATESYYGELFCGRISCRLWQVIGSTNPVNGCSCGVGEYLGCFIKANWNQEDLPTGHSIVETLPISPWFIIPLWNCNALWHDNSLGFQSDERQKIMFTT
jgi:hypothetical protein